MNCRVVQAGSESDMVIPRMKAQGLTTPAQIHRALAPAWKSLVEERNAAGLVAPKEEGQAQAPLGPEEAAFQYDRVQRGEVDSARLLLVFGMVPSARYLDDSTSRFLTEHDEGRNESRGELEVHLASHRYADGASPLHMAAMFGFPEALRSLLQSGADLNVTSQSGLQAIHAAAIAGHADVVEILVEHGADPNSRHGFAGNSPLHFAAEMGHLSVVRRLCDLKADVEAEKMQGGTALHTAADTNNAAVAQVLLEACAADPEALLLGDTVPLYLAAGRGFPKVIDVLIAGGANPDRTLRSRRVRSKGKVTSASLPGSSPDAPGWEEGNGATPLHNACENGHLSAVRALLDAGARQLNTMEGVTPLITALQYSHPEIAMALLDGRTPAQLDVTSPRDGQSALHIASGLGFATVVARILHLGGRSDVPDRAGHLPLDYAASGPVRWLLQRFHGRDRRLDSIARSYLSSGLEEALGQIDGADVSAVKKETYRKYLAAHHDGTLPEEVSRLARLIKEDVGEMAMFQFSVARYLLAGASDLPTAIEAMLSGDSETSVQVGLVLLGVTRKVSYQPGKALWVNGVQLLPQLQNLLKAAAETSDAAALEEMAQDLLRSIEPLQRSEL
ncbi:unnamed protein product [Cladocopium goreaui]|uniref:Ankyrin repeat and protein kinase domain-containing protein 1 n=2 Tax=Cladocopium goreaui TaxID=2562237 RepID=A0A9P1FXL9_9DINO|nr:unnamed protein product [Cladocopium goreaui]